MSSVRVTATSSRGSFASLLAHSDGGGEATSSNANDAEQDLQEFLRELDAVQIGPLQELEAILVECKELHARALKAVVPAAERDALAAAEALAERASQTAATASNALQELGSKIHCRSGPSFNSSEGNLRRQSFSAVTMLYQNALNAFFEAQQSFRAAMEEKVSRQLRLAFPDANDAELQRVASESGSAGSTIQDTVLRQSGTGPLCASLALELTRERCDDLERLVKASRELKQAFVDVELLVNAQGDAFDDIGNRMRATRDQTQAAREHLERAHASRQQLRRCRWCACQILVIIAGLVALIAFIFWAGKRT